MGDKLAEAGFETILAGLILALSQGEREDASEASWTLFDAVSNAERCLFFPASGAVKIP
jgi:hypothetical protein